MRTNRWLRLVVFALCLFPLSRLHSAPDPAVLPMPRMMVPRTVHPPVIDGIMQPGEWDRAAACTGFVKAFDGGLAPVQSTAWVTFDSSYIYIAFRNFRAEQLTFLTAAARRPDDERIVYDPSNEIWISPPGSPATTYQTLTNVYPAVLDVKMIPPLGYSSKSWSGKWERASSSRKFPAWGCWRPSVSGYPGSTLPEPVSGGKERERHCAQTGVQPSALDESSYGSAPGN